MKPQIYLYNNRFTGEVLPLTKQQGKKLSEDWSRVKPVINDKGQRVLRMKMEGGTVDIRETEVDKNVVPGSK
jgi:rRNA processing protein Krr1/Pno1